ncbi:transglutaminase family protein [Teichococcus vastitatis]|uniref:Transglutaminase family protein n=1 Tax=Teichococcus vastitatis TaxID=2307076 RepID=A0ABS9W1E0_9PROT|nr:transglutaminase family protein [Pseudoroseomonas vastitatis]MCI0752740.1 transglutaminase family protein [Pseudoroseomonas vastitatis]
MSIHVALIHRTSYRYDRPVTLGPQTIRLRPAPHARTPVLSYALQIQPKNHFINWQQDPQGNFLARVVFPEPVTRFEVTVDLVADMATINPFDFFLEPEAETWPFTYDPVLEQELAPFRRAVAPGPLLTALLAEVPQDQQGTVTMLTQINALVNRKVSYIVRLEPGVWTPEETLAEGRGSCRDSTWLLVQLMRHLGYAARFVSGYLIQLVADQKPLEGPEGPSTDFTDLHAWAEVYLPGAGWVGLDATSGLLTGEGHIPLAATPEPQSAAPISGLMSKAEVAFDFGMGVSRVRETPRVTKPYSEQAWAAILAAGEAVDGQLKEGGVRLTMGGEPTFVSATDLEADEWNTTALGPTKRRMAGRLLKRLVPEWAPGGVVQYATGKHYPGEQLPRWALNAFWRKDGEPVWMNPALLSDDDHADHADAADAAAFARSLTERLGLAPHFVQPAHEDIHYYLWKENRLPANVVAEGAKLRDPLERARLARVFGQGLGSSVGSVLPLRRSADGACWETGWWLFREGNPIFLIPGDSPIGFRLPLESLPWADPAAIPAQFERDPFAPHPSLPPAPAFRQASLPGRAGPQDGSPGFPLRHQTVADSVSAGTEGLLPAAASFRRSAAPAAKIQPPPAARPQHNRPEPDPVRTALAVEARGGRLHVFFPPLYAIEDWLELCAAVEDTAAATGRRVVLEGYGPPSDPRIESFSVTPDPGVIEVNIHPSRSWSVHVARTERLYALAREEGLAAEKFMLDGRHVGTGGGNHVVMGGDTTAESPFLRRPDLLKSLVGFWHNHPSLSFLFAGLFIGPTSQHPRIDEARQDILNDLEIAFAQVKPFEPAPPWKTDRLFRNVLADMTGNTHRTEFCIDKMYSPDGPGGRRGLVEFRAFEMPPSPQMSVAQMLLMRAAVAAFWKTPYERRLVRWGSRLHDDFMLPHYAEQDFADVIEELRSLGAPLEKSWFDPHLAFRFPVLGETTVRDVGLELRHALEPWHVLGEESTASGTARYVDSSTERLQLRATGFVPERFVLGVNGRALPMASTGRAGEYVAGVRFKAWAPPSALHPGIGAQAPLTFDLWDSWTGRSLGGFTHHVVHPGGRNYERFPVNANEAEARRRSRFFAFGHSQGARPAPVVVQGAELRRTLDLRRLA